MMGLHQHTARTSREQGCWRETSQGVLQAPKGKCLDAAAIGDKEKKELFHSFLKHIFILGKVDLSFPMYSILRSLYLSLVEYYFLLKRCPKMPINPCYLSSAYLLVLTLAFKYSLEYVFGEHAVLECIPESQPLLWTSKPGSNSNSKNPSHHFGESKQPHFSKFACQKLSPHTHLVFSSKNNIVTG